MKSTHLRTQIVSHRGGSLLWSENSHTAFSNTAKLGVDRVEFDVHPTRDGCLVVMHDATVDRMTNGRGAVVEKSWTDLKELTLNGTAGDRILLLKDVLALFRPTPLALQIELKPDKDRRIYSNMAPLLAAELSDEVTLARTILTSFQLEMLTAVRGSLKPRGFVWLVSKLVWQDVGERAIIGLARSNALTGISIHESFLDAAIVDAARSAGLEIGGYGAHTVEAIARMLDMDIDFFTTDRPDTAVTMRQKRNMHDSSRDSNA